MNRQPDARFLAWALVGVGFITLAISFSSRAVLGLTLSEIERELGWSRTLMSDIAGWTLIVMAILAPISGNLVDRLGPKLLLTGGLLAVGLGMFASAFAHEVWHFYLAFSGLTAIGFGMIATHIVSTVVSQRFEANRGLAVGIATSGSTAGQFLVVPLVSLVLAAIGWRASFSALAVAALALIPLVLWLLRGQGGPVQRGHGTARESLGSRLAALLRSPVFHALFWSFFICGFTTTGIIETHFLPYAAFCGFPPQQSATAYGLLMAINLGGMILSGWLTDRMSRPLLLGSIYILRGFSFILLLYAAADIDLLFAFAVVFGVFDYSTVPPTASLVASRLGMKVMGLAMGLLSAGHSLGGAVANFMAGRIFDWSQKYDPIWLAAFGLAIAAGFMAFAIRDDRARPLRPAFAA